MGAELKRTIIGAAIAVALTLAMLVPAAAAASDGVEHLHFAAGPYRVIPGANLILDQLNNVPKPTVNGFMVRMKPNLVYAQPNGKCCGKVPSTSVIHLHHGVWLSNGAAGQGEGEGTSYGGFYPFMAAGEEKTTYEFPPGFGYPIGAGDKWILNYMIHNLTDKPKSVYITYDIDFVPETSAVASTIAPIHPIWMDVEDDHIYPVFNVHRHSGRDGRFTFPDMAKNPYGGGRPLNLFTVDHPGTLVATAGHLHPGGLYDELDLLRPGARPRPGTTPGSVPGSVRLFRSYARYWDPHHAPVSWDVSMTATRADWRPAVKSGDVLRISATYETKLASWYEVMGIMVVWEQWNSDQGIDPFSHRLDQVGEVTHGHLPENFDYGGTQFLGVNPTSAPLCDTHKVLIAGFSYIPVTRGNSNCDPTIRRGQSLTFVNADASASPLSKLNPIAPDALYLASVFHTVTSCAGPCRLNYGIAYPLSNGAGDYDSGELGIGTPGVGRVSWSTPTTLGPGTYTYYCRIHPWMRGVFRILG
ncbi:MAG: hypothetical protein JO168_10500 [Solirubrobacterales bacterium]|nr:hypothetical protein [Solirubrobacterales bacterium]MBV9716983.1 hypothetical protein [Solirubrobacterales bacterium]